jgi:hypothetical protein
LKISWSCGWLAETPFASGTYAGKTVFKPEDGLEKRAHVKSPLDN